jgi:hypothetical protein
MLNFSCSRVFWTPGEAKGKPFLCISNVHVLTIGTCLRFEVDTKKQIYIQRKRESGNSIKHEHGMNYDSTTCHILYFNIQEKGKLFKYF